MLGLVLGNLFDNAVRHSDQGGTVTIAASIEAHEAVIGVRNTGCNVSPDNAETVFERFWIGDTARTAGARHCGLGLTLCRRVVEALGGSIDAAIKNGWFTVKFGLPLGKNEEV